MAENGNLEIEWQFEAPDLAAVEAWLQALPAASGTRIEPHAAVQQNDTYFDCEDWALQRARFTLRIRSKPGGREATLKSFAQQRAGGLTRRLEINQPLADQALLPGDSDGGVSRRLQQIAADGPLRQLFSVETLRKPFTIERDGVLVGEVALDETRVVAPDRREHALRRVEIEAAAPQHVPALEAFVAEMREALDLRKAERSKFETGLLLAGYDPAAVRGF